MLDKLKNISKRYDAINEKLSDPAIFSDKQEFAALMRERKGLEPVVEKYGEYKTALDEMDEAKELLSSHPDEELKEMAEAQLEEAKEAKTRLEEEIKILLLPRYPNDDRSVIMEIRVQPFEVRKRRSPCSACSRNGIAGQNTDLNGDGCGFARG